MEPPIKYPPYLVIAKEIRFLDTFDKSVSAYLLNIDV